MTTPRGRRQATQEDLDIAQVLEEEEENEQSMATDNIDAQEYETFMKWRDSQASKKAGGKARRSALQALKKAHEPEYEGLVAQFKAQGMD